ncbi:MAG: divergent polysaccharide deacetylase family protein [Terricaulis sp.]
MPPRPQQQKKLPQLNHKLGALLAFGVLGVVVFGAIQVFGDPSAAGPRRVIALNPSTASAEAAPRVAFSDVAAGTELEPLDYDPAAPEGLGSDPLPDSETPGELRVALVETPGAARPAASSPPLPRAPLAGLTEPGPNGPLPVISRDGRAPSAAYARPFTADATKPSVAVIIGGLGFNARATTQAIDELPAEITLSFVPYAANLQSWIDRARARGHEVMLELPMEPFDPDADDTGPQTLLATAAATQNITRLEQLLSKGAGYFGVTNYQGARFATSAAASQPVVQALRRRGLVFISSGIGQRTALSVEAARAGLANTAADRIIDARREADAIDEQLLNLEALALQNHSAIGAGFAYPVTMEQVGSWARDIGSRGYQLAPASAVLNARAARR